MARYPGYWIKRFLGRSLSVPQLAVSMQITEDLVNQLLIGEHSITPVVAERLSRAVGGSPDYWLEMQLEYDRFRAFGEDSGGLTSILDAFSRSLPEFVEIAVSGAPYIHYLVVNGFFFRLGEGDSELDLNVVLRSLGSPVDPWNFGDYYDADLKLSPLEESSPAMGLINEIKDNLGELDVILLVGRKKLELLLRGNRPIAPLPDVTYSDFLSWLQGLDKEALDPDTDVLI